MERIILYFGIILLVGCGSKSEKSNVSKFVELYYENKTDLPAPFLNISSLNHFTKPILNKNLPDKGIFSPNFKIQEDGFYNLRLNEEHLVYLCNGCKIYITEEINNVTFKGDNSELNQQIEDFKIREIFYLETIKHSFDDVINNKASIDEFKSKMELNIESFNKEVDKTFKNDKNDLRLIIKTNYKYLSGALIFMLFEQIVYKNKEYSILPKFEPLFEKFELNNLELLNISDKYLHFLSKYYMSMFFSINKKKFKDEIEMSNFLKEQNTNDLIRQSILVFNFFILENENLNIEFFKKEITDPSLIEFMMYKKLH